MRSMSLRDLERAGKRAFAVQDPKLKPSTAASYEAHFRRMLRLLATQKGPAAHFTERQISKLIRQYGWSESTRKNILTALRYVKKKAGRGFGVSPHKCGTLFERDLRNILNERKQEYGDQLMVEPHTRFGRKLQGSPWAIDIFFWFYGDGIGIEAREQYVGGSALDKIPAAVLHLETSMRAIPDMKRGYVVVRGSELVSYLWQLRKHGYGVLAPHLKDIHIVTMEEFVELLDKGLI